MATGNPAETPRHIINHDGILGEQVQKIGLPPIAQEHLLNAMNSAGTGDYFLSQDSRGDDSASAVTTLCRRIS